MTLAGKWCIGERWTEVSLSGVAFLVIHGKK
jgi:hypothetical protein